jgi:hypothetical protein
MITIANLGRFAVTAALGVLAAACVVETHDETRRVDETGGPSGSDAPPAPAPGSGSGSGSGSTSGVTPIVVVVDSDRTMNAAPGEGVGVFTEYASGGHWHVWWTCDTAKTGQSCAFDVSAHVDTGTARNVTFTNAPAGTTDGAADIHATSTLTNDLSEVDFDADPGATVTLTATVGGLSDPSFFFFVQDGKVNGGYGGHLTNPLRFQGSKP